MRADYRIQFPPSRLCRAVWQALCCGMTVCRVVLLSDGNSPKFAGCVAWSWWWQATCGWRPRWAPAFTCAEAAGPGGPASAVA
jgi:hypothetical protein